MLWAIVQPNRLERTIRAILDDRANVLVVSAASLWEVAIKSSARRSDFDVDAHVLRRQLAEDGYEELPVVGEHAIAVASLPPIHRDPFDRLLVAQATVEGITLLTSDSIVARYPGPIRKI